jgi:hypothetical protein
LRIILKFPRFKALGLWFCTGIGRREKAPSLGYHGVHKLVLLLHASSG